MIIVHTYVSRRQHGNGNVTIHDFITPLVLTPIDFRYT